MLKKYVTRLCFIIVIALIFTACQKVDGPSALSPEQYSSNQAYHEATLASFVKNKLRSEFGVNTNYVDNEQLAEVATGHETLSESSGLLLQYYVKTQNQKEFDSLLKQTETVFNMERGFSYRYSPLTEENYMINMAIDDLRIIGSMIDAYNTFGNENYLKGAIKYGERFVTYNTSEVRLFNSYDFTYETAHEFISLNAINLRVLVAMEELVELDGLSSAMLAIAKEGYISDDFPFYETDYIYKTKEYYSENINTIESLMTILHLAEVGEHNTNSITFIKEKINEEKLIGQYTQDGTALNEVQSPAIYALTAMIGSVVGDEELYNKSIALMEQARIADREHELFGAYGDAESLQLYSFDNLQALLAYSYQNKK